MKQQLKIIGMGAASFIGLAVMFVYAASADPFDQSLKPVNRFKCKRKGKQNTVIYLTLSKTSATLGQYPSEPTRKSRIHAGLNNDWGHVHLGWARYGTFSDHRDPFDLQVEKHLIEGHKTGNISKSTMSGFDYVYQCSRIN
ncbi:MAG TPA: hypothetical protein VNJ01_07355 [Bacteriovoracaceae bacterium]|nr:hypothetical protein [Bacteriovoracaceae bacterium]